MTPTIQEIISNALGKKKSTLSRDRCLCEHFCKQYKKQEAVSHLRQLQKDGNRGRTGVKSSILIAKRLQHPCEHPYCL